MIDMHTHILPEIDDGAKNVETAVKMLEYAQAQGVETLVFTPHYYGKLSVEDFLNKRQKAFESIEKHIPEDIKAYMGAEVHFDRANLRQMEELSVLSIAGTRYILLELPFMDKWSSLLLEKLCGFIEETDCIPILAHVERYTEVRKNPALVSTFINMGCLIQVNASSFFNKKASGLVFALLKKGLVHCIGSDTHDMEKRISHLREAKELIEKEGYAEEFSFIQNNMERILNGGIIRIDKIKKVKKIFGFYF